MLVSRQHPGQHHPGYDPSGQALPATHDPNAETPPEPHHPSGVDGLAGRLRAAMVLLPPTLGGGPHPTTGSRPGHPRHPTRPTHRPGRARRRLCLPPLPTTPGLVRRPSCAPLAAWRPHRPGQPGPALPSPPPSRARGRLATHPPTRRPADRHPTASATSHRPATSQRRLEPSCKAAHPRLRSRLGSAEDHASRAPWLWYLHGARQPRPTVPPNGTRPEPLLPPATIRTQRNGPGHPTRRYTWS